MQTFELRKHRFGNCFTEVFYFCRSMLQLSHKCTLTCAFVDTTSIYSQTGAGMAVLQRHYSALIVEEGRSVRIVLATIPGRRRNGGREKGAENRR